MNTGTSKRLSIFVLLAALGLVIFLAITHPYTIDVSYEATSSPDIKNGKYMFAAAGCANCHEAEDGSGALSGGHGLKSPFGTFYAPNIANVGAEWSEADFIVALKSGVSPDGKHYFPAFPYTTYRHMKEQDIIDMLGFMQSLLESDAENKPHDVPFPFNIRRTLGGWKTMFLGKGDYDFAKLSDDPQIQRGAYLVNAVAHCG
ncbi:MAG: c-type cytochrome, partial [Alphaproteobacteria bacterium]